MLRSQCSIRSFLLLVVLVLVLPSEYGALNSDEDTEGEPLELIYSQRIRLTKVDLRPPSKSSVIVDHLSNAVALDYHFEKKLVVWTDVRDKGIYSADIDHKGTTKTIARNRVVTPDGLAVDWIHENIYWTDTGTDTISVASLDGEMRKLLFHENLDEPRAIVVNPLEGWMFWTDWGKQAKIERSGMDGTLRSTIVSKNIHVPNGLTIDYETKRLFWADVASHDLRSCDYDGSNVKVILFSLALIGHPFAVDVYQDWLYWSDWGSHRISKVLKETGTLPQTVSSSFSSFPMDLKVYHSSKQPKGRSVCGEKNVLCSFLCLPAPKGTARQDNFTCACPDGKTCITTHAPTEKSNPNFPFGRISTPKTITNTSFVESASQSKLESNSMDKILQEIHENVYYYGKLAGITFGTLVFLIISISVVGCCLYKPNLRRNIPRLNFVNPVFGKQTEEQA